VETNPPRNTRLRLIETVRKPWGEVKIRFALRCSKITGRKIADASKNSCDQLRRSRLHTACHQRGSICVSLSQ
jgi:hypothetical protein